MDFPTAYHTLLKAIGEMDAVLSIGKSGGAQLPQHGESDIDIFVFCSDTPSVRQRKNAVNNAGVAITRATYSETAGRFWGLCDFIQIDRNEICLMYFTVSGVSAEIDSILNGQRLQRENEYFYPTGRCASFLTMHILYEKTGFIQDMQEKLSHYPAALSAQLWHCHSNKINDEEDFERAVSKGDVLFYHATLELALDHYLQALFALNKCFFPSRKRSLSFIEGFAHKPQNCGERLQTVIALGAMPGTLSKSYRQWVALCDELMALTSFLE